MTNNLTHSDPVDIQPCTRADFDEILSRHGEFWDSDLTLQLHHPMFVHEFGDTAFVVREARHEGIRLRRTQSHEGSVENRKQATENGELRIIAYLFGFLSQTSPTAYVHMVAVHSDCRGRGLARKLYMHFIDIARRRGCTRLKATAAATNALSIQFHTSLGMQMLGEPNADGVPVVRGYLRPGFDRVVFDMAI